MSSAAPAAPRTTSDTRRFSIVASKFNARFVQGLVAHATEELRKLRPSAAVTLHEVPGAFEIPVVARAIAARGEVNAVLALGVIIQGSTAHAEHLAVSVTNALQQIAIEYGVPVINAVLAVENEAQASERCLEEKINRGVEAARAAVEIADVIANLQER
jgi:6,7-dimethyl-8-ribityllumazine synthase